MDLYLNKKRITESALARFLNRCTDDQVEIHALMIEKDGELICRMGVPPYTCGHKRQVFSMSKSFTSTAVGFAYDEGLLKPEEKVLSFFPDQVCCGDRALWEKLTVEDLLTMQTGHIVDPTEVSVTMSDDWVGAFFHCPLMKEPGTHYVYNTAATYILSVIVTMLTGMTVLDYLWPRLFEPLDIVPEGWGVCPMGVSQGGWGLHISAEDALKFGRFYADGGVWKGEQLLSKEWVDRATSNHRLAINEADNPDWKMGYGYQFWMNCRGGYRGDGARGQFVLVYPDGYVVSCLAMTAFTQKQLDHISTLLDELTVESGDDLQTAFARVNGAYFGEEKLVLPEGSWLAAPNHFDITWVKFLADEEGAALLISNGELIQKIRFGSEDWIENRFSLHNMEPDIQLVRRPHDDPSHAACAVRAENGELHLTLRFLDTPHVLEIFTETWEDTLTLRLDWGGAGYDDAARFIRLKKM